MQTLKIPATRGNYLNVKRHILRYLKTALDAEDKQELVRAINSYRAGLLSPIVSVTLLNQYCHKFPSSHIANSSYMKPYAAELKLQNEI